jgi:YfiH family protein
MIAVETGLEALRSDLLGEARHAFFTRRGGASSGVYAGLNCGLGSSDQAEIVALNRARAAREMGVRPANLRAVEQVHSARAVTGAQAAALRERADALVTDRPEEVLTILTADCQPVLFHDAEAGVIGAAHAGWRGALDGVLEATVDAMEALGARRATIRAAIGPSISQRAYEVGPEFVARFDAADPESLGYFRPGPGDRHLFDLPGYGLHRLRRAGVRAEWIGACTYSEPERFYSYRRSVHDGAADYGRLLAAIRL